MSKKITIVDDDPAILEVLKIILEDKGYSITLIEDAIDVTERILKEKPDLILLDNLMPGRSGAEIVKELKFIEKTKLIPIIMISANHDIKKIVKDVGADGFLAKPFDMEELLLLLHKYFK